jgi:4-amino-4-deoxy-L-arabinose transferase-like glycosyltransferase
MSYVSSARGLLAGTGMGRWTGLGVFKPMTHYPPFYAIVLAICSLFSEDILANARLISALGYGLTAFLVGAIVYRRTAQPLPAMLAAALSAGSGVLLRSFAWAMSEPLYMVLELSGWLLLDRYLQTGKRRILSAAAIVLGMALLTRYVGFSAIAVSSLVLLLNTHQMLRRRLMDGVAFLACAATPISLWMVRNWLVADTLTNRSLTWHPPTPANWDQLRQAILSWGLVPQRLVVGHETLMFPMVAGGLLAISLVWLWFVRPDPAKPPQLEFTLLLASLAYLGLVSITISLLDITTPLDNRILIPVYIKVLALACCAVGLLWRTDRRIWQAAALVGAFWLAYFTFSRLDGALLALRQDGQGYASLRWQNSATMAALRSLNPDLIYTNDITAVYFLAEQPSVGIPNAWVGEPGLGEMRQNLQRDQAYLVLFGKLTGEFATFEDLIQGLTLVGQWEDGVIYSSIY